MTTATHTVRRTQGTVYGGCLGSMGEKCPKVPTWCETVRWTVCGTTTASAFYYYCDAHKPAWAEGGAS